MKPHPRNVVPLAMAVAGFVFNQSVMQPAQAAAFITNSPMASARTEHTATLLPSGQVLVAGGFWGGFTYLSSAELFNASSGSWTNTGTWPTNGVFTTARKAHTATLLTNGQVLVAGGIDSALLYSTSDLYDPASGTWTFTGYLKTPRAYHTATLLLNGQVLCTGGQGLTSFATNSAELYDPIAGTWTNTGTLNASRSYHTATLLPNGKVLVAGGAYSGLLALRPVAELYDPATGEWTNTGTMITPRQNHTATLLADGRVLVAGGLGFSGYASIAELYDPQTGTWTNTGTLNTGRYWHTATLLLNGKVLIAGGTAPNSIAEIYDPTTGTWASAGALNRARNYHTATLLPNGQVLIAGGGRSIVLSSTELFDVLLKAVATVTLGNLSQTYDGTAKSVAATTIPAGLTVNLSYNGSPDVPTNVGSYTVIGTINDLNYQGSATNTLVVGLPTISLSWETLTHGAFNLSFTNAPGASFTVLTTTNLSLSFDNWTVLGCATETSLGQFQFTDPHATNSSQRFYIVRSP